MTIGVLLTLPPFMWWSNNLTERKEMIAQTVLRNPEASPIHATALQCASNEVREDKELVSDVVSKNGQALKYVKMDKESDAYKELVEKALSQQKN